jgi:hypothetical protein
MNINREMFRVCGDDGLRLGGAKVGMICKDQRYILFTLKGAVDWIANDICSEYPSERDSFKIVHLENKVIKGIYSFKESERILKLSEI